MFDTCVEHDYQYCRMVNFCYWRSTSDVQSMGESTEV